MKLIMLVGLVITYVSAFVPWAFVILYQVVTRGAWRRDNMGWHVMTLTAVDGLIFSMLVAADIHPQLASQP